MKNLKRLRKRRSKVLVAIMMSMLITQGLYSSDSIIVSAQEQTANHSKNTVNHNQKEMLCIMETGQFGRTGKLLSKGYTSR
ncbi:hypothetical protein AAIB48_06600 [Paraclostridium benzoelyticum]|uniref:hypothetical protein n=1 Tax=Paraclostridium benzoelyticum TaxID=1629550 RepID=UPI0031CD67B9